RGSIPPTGAGDHRSAAAARQAGLAGATGRGDLPPGFPGSPIPMVRSLAPPLEGGSEVLVPPAASSLSIAELRSQLIGQKINSSARPAGYVPSSTGRAARPVLRAQRAHPVRGAWRWP